MGFQKIATQFSKTKQIFLLYTTYLGKLLLENTALNQASPTTFLYNPIFLTGDTQEK